MVTKGRMNNISKYFILINIILLLILPTVNPIITQKQIANLENNTTLDNQSTTINEHPWPMFRHDTQHTGQTSYTGPETPTLSWKFKANKGIVSSAAISKNHTIYFGTGWDLSDIDDGSLYALHDDGTLKWKFDANNGFYSSPAIDEKNMIYVTSLDGSIYAIEDQQTKGELQWKKYLRFFFNLCSPTIDSDGIIHVGSPSYDYYQITSDGLTKWRHKTDWCIISSPAISKEGIVYIGSKDHHLYAFSTNPSRLQWKFQTGTFFDGHLVDSSPAIGEDGTIYVGTDPYDAFGQEPIPVKDNFWAINPNGTLKWVFETEDGVESSPAIGPDGTIYFGSYDGYLYAVEDKETYGMLKWKFKTNDAIDGSPIIDGDGVIYFGSRDNILYSLYPNGTIKWTFQAEGGFSSSPSIDDNGFLYIGSLDEYFYCIGTGGPDMGVNEIDVPIHIIPNITITPTAQIKNYRSLKETCNVTCEIYKNQTLLYQEIQQITIDGGETHLIHFPQLDLGNKLHDAYNLIIRTDHPLDKNSYNDQRNITLITTINNAPNPPTITGPTNGKKNTEYEYFFTTIEPDNDQIFYLIDWGDNTLTQWIGPFESNLKINTTYIWEENGNYEIKVKAKDIYDKESNWTILQVTMSKNKFNLQQMINQILHSLTFKIQYQTYFKY